MQRGSAGVRIFAPGEDWFEMYNAVASFCPETVIAFTRGMHLEIFTITRGALRPSRKRILVEAL